MIETVNDDLLLIGDNQSGYSFEIIDDRRNSVAKPYSPLDAFNVQGYVSRIAGWNVFPYGEDNKLPISIRNAVYQNSIAPGILNKKTGMNWGQGPKLYKEVFENKAYFRDYQSDAEVEAWLDSWDWEKYILKCAIDFSHIESCFTKMPFKRSYRIGEPAFVPFLEHIQPHKTMVVGKEKIPTHVMLPKENNPNEFEVFPLYKRNEKNALGVSIIYSDLPSFCSDFFTIPSILGSLPWIQNSTNVPKMIDALTRNSINIKYHITSPKAYWEQKREDIKKSCEELRKPYKEVMFKKFRKQMLQELQNVLSGIDNAGKFWHSEMVLEYRGANLLELGWKITPIDQNMKDVVDAYMKIAEMADRSSAAGIGVDASLGNITSSSESKSGSHQYYAFNNHLQNGIDIPEMVIMEGINTALKINFPNKKLKMGFYHTSMNRQQDVSVDQRAQP